MRVAIIGGGAAGFFAAIQVKENHPNADVTIFEKSKKTLTKVKISGGGRCNVSNACAVSELPKAYPRGNRFLKRLFYTFNNHDAMQWFESKGVPLEIQSDLCVFPKTQKSQTIIDLFTKETARLAIPIKLRMKATSIVPKSGLLEINFQDNHTQQFEKVIITTGGSPKKQGLEWLQNLNHSIQSPVPSLFTFNMPNEPITKLMGVVVENTSVSIQGSKIKTTGALLITHWGMSGPAIIKLSSYAARLLNEKNYLFTVQINWAKGENNETIHQKLVEIIQKNPHKMLSKIKPFALPERLWIYILEKAMLSSQKRWNELGKKGINKLVNLLTNDTYSVEEKTNFKEEFVTCGGIDLKNINGNTMQSKVVNNLYFAGEILDIDGITGGYNFQAAWTTAYVASKLLN